MIDNALKIIANELNKYVVRKLDPDRDPSSTKRFAIGNIAKAQDADASGSRSDTVSAPGIVTLVNIEEERNARSVNNYVKVNDKIEYKNPKVFLNLYCLFSINHNSYETSLQYLSLVIQFFQYRNVITQRNTPSDNGLVLDPKIDKLIFDMVSMNAEQINHLWAVLGGKYFPSVLYKVRMITIEDDTAGQPGQFISGLSINEQAF
jgi:Pvc16 N-terminal domain